MFLTPIIGVSAAIKGAKIGDSIAKGAKAIGEQAAQTKKENEVLDMWKKNHPEDSKKKLLAKHAIREDYSKSGGNISDKNEKLLGMMGLTEQDLVRPRSSAQLAAEQKRESRAASMAEKAEAKRKKEAEMARKQRLMKTPEGRVKLAAEEEARRKAASEARKKAAQEKKRQLAEDQAVVAARKTARLKKKLGLPYQGDLRYRRKF